MDQGYVYSIRASRPAQQYAPGCPVVLKGGRLEVNRESLGAARALLA